MSLYTMTIYEMVNNPLTPIFNFDYPFYVDSDHLKKNFEQKFIDYYYFDEIGSETFNRWEHQLKSRLHMKMPYWKQLYETELRCKDIDFMLNKDLVETFSRDISGSDTSKRVGATDQTNNSMSKGDSSGSSNANGKHSSIENGLGSVSLSEGYLTGVDGTEQSSSAKQTMDVNSTSTSNINEDNSKEHNQKETTELISKGNIGVTSSAELLDKWRKVLINLDEMIIEDCKDLFMEVY